MLGWTLCILYIIGLFFIIGRCQFFRSEYLDVRVFQLLFGIKLLAAGIFFWIYTFHYTDRNESDIYKYYDDGIVVSGIAASYPLDYAKIILGCSNISPGAKELLSTTKYWDRSPSIAGFNDNRLIIKINALLSHLSQGQFFTHMVFGSFISFIGLVFLFKFFAPMRADHHLLLALLIFLLPSVLFWTSAILKECLSTLAIGGFLYSLSSKKTTFIKVLCALFFFALLINAKLYLAIVMLPALISFGWNRGKNDGKVFWRYLVVNLLLLALALQLSTILGISLQSIIAQKQEEFKCLAEWMNAGSLVYIPSIEGNWISIIRATPYAFYNALLRPTLLDELNRLSFLAMIEILALSAMAVAAIIAPNRNRADLNPVSIAFINASFILVCLIGITTPVLGAIVRYRMPIFMILAPIIFNYLDLNMLKFKIKTL
ncbi:MAG: hypothetical protein RIC15_12510 [Vicingaceae bacterium]